MDAANNAQMETVLVEEGLGGDNEVCLFDLPGQFNFIGDHHRARQKFGTNGRKSARQSASGPAAPHVGDVDPVVIEVDLAKPFQSPTKQFCLRGRCTFGCGETIGRIDEQSVDIAGDEEADATQAARRKDGPDRPQSSVGSGIAARPDDDSLCASLHGCGNKFARSVGSCCDGIIAFSAAHEMQARGQARLDHRCCPPESPRHLHGVAKWTHHEGAPVRPAERCQ